MVLDDYVLGLQQELHLVHARVNAYELVPVQQTSHMFHIISRKTENEWHMLASDCGLRPHSVKCLAVGVRRLLVVC